MISGAERLVLTAFAITIGVAQTAPPTQHVIGGVTVVVPAPEGFVDGFTLPDGRARFGDTELLETLAAFVPASMVKNYSAEQDIPFYAKAAVGKAFKTVVASSADVDDLAERFRSGAVGNEWKGVEQLRERGITPSRPINLGVIDRTPQSMTALLATSLTTADRSMFILMATTSMVVKTRMLNLQAFRKFDSVADRTELEAFNKAWVRRIIAANP